MQLKMIFLMLLITLLISGCFGNEPVPVPQKCTVPETEEPVIDNRKYNNANEIVVKALTNYVNMKEYADRLLINSKACQ